MKIPDLHKRPDILPAAGRLLIAEPFLNDPNFLRSVVFICEHSPEGTVGFTLHKFTELKLADVLPDIQDFTLDIYQGGPVETNTLHILHANPVLLGGNEIAPGIYWGGDFEKLRELISCYSHRDLDIKLFLGYSGWSADQLENEIKHGSWLVAECPANLLFNTEAETVWQAAITSLGNAYKHLLHMPLNPQLN